MIKVLQVVVAPNGFNTKLSVTGPERRAANLAARWIQYDIEIVICYPSRGNMNEYFHAANLPVIDFEIGSKFNMAAVLKLRDIIRKYDVHLVHAQGPASLDLIVALACRLAGVRAVISRPVMIEDQVTYSPLRKFIYATIDRLITLKLVNGLIAVSRAGQLHMQRVCKVRPERIRLIHNGVNLNRFVQRQSSSADGKAPNHQVTLGMVAQLFPPKGWPDFIEVIDRLVQRNWHVKAMIVGEGQLRAELEADVIKRGLQDVITFTGFQDDVASLYQQMDIFLFTTHREGLSVAVIEGMASGVPFVATEVGGIREQIEEGVNGFVVPARDIEKLVEGCERLIGDPALRRQMGQRSHEMALERFSDQRMLEEHVEYYRALAAVGH